MPIAGSSAGAISAGASAAPAGGTSSTSANAFTVQLGLDKAERFDLGYLRSRHRELFVRRRGPLTAATVSATGSSAVTIAGSSAASACAISIAVSSSSLADARPAARVVFLRVAVRSF